MDRINRLRKEMEKQQVDFYLVPTGDFHGSEYVCETFKGRGYLSGFSGSAGTLVVSGQKAGLWTDGRYFIQAEKELTGTGIDLFRMGEEGVPAISEYLKNEMKSGETLAFDGRCISARMGICYEEELADYNIRIEYDRDLIEEIWKERPELPCNKVWHLSEEWSGKPVKEKIGEVRKAMAEKKADCHLLTRLDDLMWLFNIRGGDIPCNPVALSYGVIEKDKAVLFIQRDALDEECRKHLLENDITIEDYHQVYSYVRQLNKRNILLDTDKCNYTLYRLVKEGAIPVCGENPTERLKAVKNDAELAHLKEIYRRDSAAVIRFIKWIKENVPCAENIDEISAAEYLDGLRKDTQGFLDFSFPTICAYGANAAMMHYETGKDQCKIGGEGLLLVDSGGQYMGGTTDVTRTVVLGKISREIRKQYTAVVRGMFNLTNAVFIKGCTGRNLDILAREPLWQMGIDYKCGTGHGIGYMLNVHEGPQNIRWRYQQDSTEAVLESGMLVSNEPGVYKAGSHGIRIENILAVIEKEKTEDGQFLGFESLTLVPVDIQGLEISEMSINDIESINNYHQKVYHVMKEYLNEEEQEWLRDVTQPIG